MTIEITEKSGTVSVGEKISLGIKYSVSRGILKSVEWDIPGKIVKKYKADFTKGEVSEIEDADKKKFMINFYWVDGANGRTFKAKCVFTSNGNETNKYLGPYPALFVLERAWGERGTPSDKTHCVPRAFT